MVVYGVSRSCLCEEMGRCDCAVVERKPEQGSHYIPYYYFFDAAELTCANFFETRNNVVGTLTERVQGVQAERE